MTCTHKICTIINRYILESVCELCVCVVCCVCMCVLLCVIVCTHSLRSCVCVFSCTHSLRSCMSLRSCVDMQAKFSNAFDSLTRQVKALRQTPLEKDVTDATSNDNWGVANSALIELARATNDYTNYAVVMKGVWEGISDKKDRWRRIFKSLVLLEYCIKNGSDRCGDEARSELHKVRSLEEFKYMEEGREKGAGIREKSKQLVELLTNAELLKNERLKARESKEKYVGIASNAAGGQTIVAPSGYVTSVTQHNETPTTFVDEESNGTSKLEEYRQRDKLRELEKQQHKPAPVTYSQSGKIVIKQPPRGSNITNINNASSSSSSSSGEEDLIDFGPPKPVQSKQPVEKPVHANTHATAAPVAAYSPVVTANPYASMAPPTGAPVGAHPYGQPVAANPYGHPVAANPYGQPVAANPYGQPVAANPYGQPVAANPYGQMGGPVGAPVSANPYGQMGLTPGAQLGANPYGQMPANSYSAAPAYAPAYGQTAPPPYGQPVPAFAQSAPKASPQSNPFAFNGL